MTKSGSVCLFIISLFFSLLRKGQESNLPCAVSRHPPRCGVFDCYCLAARRPRWFSPRGSCLAGFPSMSPGEFGTPGESQCLPCGFRAISAGWPSLGSHPLTIFFMSVLRSARRRRHIPPPCTLPCLLSRARQGSTPCIDSPGSQPLSR